MNVTFRQLRLFLALADTGSVSAAARLMHVTQPSASMQLREVTEAVGLPLYDVIARKVYLTEAGRQLARSARDMVGVWEGFEQSVNAMKGLTRGRLKVAIASTAKYFVPKLLGSFCEHHPGIDVSLEILNREGVIQRLRDNRDDLYVTTLPPEDIELDDQLFLPDPLVLIAPAGHRLHGQQGLCLTDLQRERFILRERGSGTRLMAERFFETQAFKPGNWIELGSNSAIKEAVAGHLGVAIMSCHALKPAELAQDFCLLSVPGLPVASHWHLVYPRSRQLSPIAQVFRSTLLQEAQHWRPWCGLDGVHGMPLPTPPDAAFRP